MKYLDSLLRWLRRGGDGARFKVLQEQLALCCSNVGNNIWIFGARQKWDHTDPGRTLRD